MTSSGDGDTPAELAAAVIQDLIEVHEDVTKLKSLLQGSPFPMDVSASKALTDGILNKLSRALSELDSGQASEGGQSSAVCSGEPIRQIEILSGKRKAAVGPDQRGSFRRRSQGNSWRRVTAKTLDDGHSWRKYGQKAIQNSSHPRSYYRCTYKPDQGCKAARQVQMSESDPSMYVISYLGDHTCRDPSTIPLIIETPGARDCENLISFGSNNNTNIMTTTTSTSTSHFMQEASQLHSSFRYSPVSTSEEVLSSLTPGSSPAEQFMQVDQLAAVVGSAGRTSSTVGSAPDWNSGEMTGGTGSFPSSPNGLGFMAGSFGNIGDDDMFDFDL